jgi:GT2 family glycosyltransferase/glycosyltransferase involved in cell wall biosynthesis
MRILLVVHGVPPEATGGTEIYTADLARALWKRGHDVTVFAREARRDQEEYRVHRDDSSGFPVVRVNHTFRDATSFEHTYRNAAIDAIAGGLLDEARPDVVHVQHFTCLSTGIAAECAARAIPFVLTLNDYWLPCHRGQLLDRDLARCAGPEPERCAVCAGLSASGRDSLHLLARGLRAIERRAPKALAGAQRRLAASVAGRVVPPDAAIATARRLEHVRDVCNRAARILAPSQTLMNQFVRFGIDASRLTRQEQGISARPQARRGRAPGEPLRLGFIGSLMASKAPHVLLEAVAGLPPGRVALTIAGGVAPYHGDASYEAVVRPLLKEPGIEWLGPVAHDRVPSLLASLDVLALPSIWIENSPFVIKEAFAAGVPVVASNLGGMAELVHDGQDGLLFSPGDAADLRRVILRLLDEPSLLPALRSGIPHVRTIDEDAAWTQQLYEDVVGERPARPGGSARPVIAAVILNYDTPSDTLLAVRSLLASRRPVDRIWVVDNGPGDACARALAPVRSAIRYIRSPGNVGFSAGCNAGIREALDEGADMVLLVNSDAVLAPDALERLEHALAAAPAAGIAAPLIASRAEPTAVASAGIAYSTASGRMRHASFGGRVADLCEGPAQEADAVSGCVMLIRREVFDRAGFFDERYFYSFEDIELCLRARRHGLGSLLVPSAVAYHEGHVSIGAASPARLYYAARNHLLLAQSARPLTDVRAFARAAGIVGLNLAYALRAPGMRRAAAVQAVFQGVADYLRDRYGPGPLR